MGVKFDVRAGLELLVFTDQDGAVPQLPMDASVGYQFDQGLFFGVRGNITPILSPYADEFGIGGGGYVGWKFDRFAVSAEYNYTVYGPNSIQSGGIGLEFYQGLFGSDLISLCAGLRAGVLETDSSMIDESAETGYNPASALLIGGALGIKVDLPID